KHVLDNAESNDLTFFARPTGAFKHTSEVTMNDASMAVPLNDGDATIHRCDSEDLALVLTKEDALGCYLEFANMEISWVDPFAGETVIGLGFPVSSATIYGRQAGAVLEKAILLSPIAFSGAVLPSTTGKMFADFKPARHFLIPYDLAHQGKH